MKTDNIKRDGCDKKNEMHWCNERAMMTNISHIVWNDVPLLPRQGHAINQTFSPTRLQTTPFNQVQL